jgi:surface polysaccharide O-acyltransferase-like enzyme
MEDMVMSETMAVFWIMILFIARFAIPLLFILGSGHLFNTWLARQNQAAK